MRPKPALQPRSARRRLPLVRLLRQRRGSAGFTVTELVVAAAILALLLTGIYQVLSSGWETYSVGDAKADMQQNARRILVVLEGDLRLIGYGYPTDPALINPLPRVTEASATLITFWADLNGVTQVLAANAATGATTLSVANASGFKVTGSPKDTIYLINGGTFESRLLSSRNTTATPNTLTLAAGTTNAYPQGSFVGRPRLVSYAYNAGQQKLSRDEGDGSGATVAAENVTAFELRYFDSADAEISTAPGVELGSTDAATKNAALNRIRRIRVTLAVKAAKTTHTSGLQTYQVTSDVRPRNL